MIKSARLAISVLLFPVLLGCAVVKFLGDLPAKCPSPAELQSDYVKASLNQSKMDGLWYEIAMKDVTQPRMCSCQTSNKTLGTETLWDKFSIQCYGRTFFSYLSFALDDTPGVMFGSWKGIPLVNRILFPNTIVDVQEDSDGNYEWVIEFQCIQGPNIFGWDWIAFYGFNFYSRSHGDEERVRIMELRARERGLGPFIDHGADLAIIDHSNCLYGH